MITSSGRALLVNNQKYIPCGLNCYQLAGQGFSEAQVDQLFALLPPYCLTRFWASQSLSMPPSGPWTSPDWSSLDYVFEAAASHRQLLLPSLSVYDDPYIDTGTAGGAPEWVSGTAYTTPIWVVYGSDAYYCTASVTSSTPPPSDPAHWSPYRQGQAWFNGGYSSPILGQAAPLSYEAWLTACVERYASSPALGMWELMSEPEVDDAGGNSPEAVAALVSFFTDMGGLVHELCPGSLVSSGVLGGGQNGVAGTSYATIHASPGVDVCSFHDYDPGLNPIAFPSDGSSGMAVRIAQAQVLDKPLLVGECGIWVSAEPPAQTPWASTDQLRAELFSSFYQAQTQAGTAGLLLWDYQPTDPTGYDIGIGDPSLDLLIGESNVAGVVSINGNLTELPEGNVQVGPITLTPSASNVTSGQTFEPSNGINTVGIPPWASMMLIIPNPENTVGLTMKGAPGDTGFPISPTQPTLLSLPASPAAELYLVAAAAFSTYLTIKFY